MSNKISNSGRMQLNYRDINSIGALIALIGFVMSGPVAFMLVKLIHPQPAWVSPAVFAANYSTVQDLPFYFGFLLIAGVLIVVATHYLSYSGEAIRIKFQLLIATGSAIIFSTLIAFNYISQTTFIHNLALNYRPEYDFAISTFSMANPLSFCWANEMWGYAFLGIATWLMAGFYHHKSKLTRFLLITNGVVSIFSVVFTIVNINWVMTTVGIVAYFAWNAIMILLMIVIYQHSRKPELF